eukprot:TRINITY_DN39209_c0_g1_i1.p2 TRINITY_DN39209_c0_g1~~TRINITY_DN39209_c0_g1_i1.p2  ORF type:complete len:110 (-),score=21.92 TRINITY_DN39209_c0_g1_i1:278-607(-)
MLCREHPAAVRDARKRGEVGSQQGSHMGWSRVPGLELESMYLQAQAEYAGGNFQDAGRTAERAYEIAKQLNNPGMESKTGVLIKSAALAASNTKVRLSPAGRGVRGYCL